ncbi:carbohydrate kinase family protein [Halostreptopolyspora alba]|uniref:Carbohydrate kinase family protein n=1 Tax=Halostreptopolyspora alba TaxID=2487137 RepID=A0A3N0EIT0_9ACTN|nr:carbohydrate kinase family protein [Nocardiopsaceae bacterium YIM 96095]
MILFCGYANVDVVARIPVMPNGGDRVHATAIDYHHGGMAANAAVAAARMGATAAFGGAVGSTALDGEFLAALTAEGVDTAWCHTDSELSTCVILVTPDGERSAISHDDGLDHTRVAAGVRRLASSGGGWLYLDGYRWPGVARALAEAETDGRVHVFVDLDGCADPAAARLALTTAHHVVAGRAQLDSLFATTGETVSAEALATQHDVVLLVTDGADGWWLATPDGHVEHGAALPVEALDTTGAGDCFSGAYLAGLDAGRPPAEAARTAAVAAGLSCTVAGARGAPDGRAVEAARSRAASPSTGSTPMRSTR